MADKKISALTGATTPLAGTEVLPIVQSGATVKVAVSDLTAGRAVSATQLTSTVAIGTAPLVVTSTTNVANLNASSLNGATFAAPGAIGGGTAAAGSFTTLGASGNVTLPFSDLSTTTGVSLVAYAASDRALRLLANSTTAAQSVAIDFNTKANRTLGGQIICAATGDFNFWTNGGGTNSANITSTGLAVTGALSATGIVTPGAFTTGTRPTKTLGGIIFDTTLNKLLIGGASAWEVVTSV